MIKIGMMIGDRYEILEKIGTGGMSDVYKAKCHKLNRYVAIKVLKQEFSENANFVSKFRIEAQAAAGLMHPNIVNVYDVGEENGIYYIVMELVEGITLKKYIEKKARLSYKEAVSIAIQVSMGIEAAHNNHIIHRDIKPQNIIISKDGKVKVTDFGIAKAATSNTITSNVMGSVHYTSPEQARGGYSDEKSDIYSLGVTMYEMLSGTLPFNGESAVAIALAHIQEEAVPLAALDATIPKGISNIVNKCMQKKTELRYSCVADLIADLKMFLQDPSGDYGVIGNLYKNDGTIFMSKDDVNTLRDASRKGMGPVEQKPEPQEPEEPEEPESNSDVDPKLEKALVFGSIGVAIIIGLVVLYMVGRVLGFWGSAKPDSNSGSSSTTASETAKPGSDTSGDEITLEDYANKIKDYVETDLSNYDITCTVTEEASDEIEKGYVIRTSPAAGSTVAKGGKVELIVSSGVEQVSIPDTTGDTIIDASKALSDKGFEVKQGEDVYSSQAIGKVAYTKPAAGKKVDKGATITIYPSKGEETKYVKVPNLLGMTRSQAKSALEKVGLKYGSETKSYSTTQKNRVCVQSVSSGSEVEEGSTVDITLSLGPETTYTYEGSVTIANPFEYETDSGTIKVVLKQDGNTTTVREEQKTYYDFPWTLDGIKGSSANQGEITVYRDGQQVATYNVTFKRVSN